MSTIKDVAKYAGVSISTVSRALSGTIFVEEETKAKVLEAVKALDYRPNVLAKGLKQGKTNTIGLIIPNICNPIFPLVSRGIEDGARKKGYTVILCNTDENIEAEKNYVDKLRERWIDGLIFATAHHDSHHIYELKKNDFPVVLVVRSLEEEIDAIVVDNFKGGYDATSYLIKTGHKKIAIINGRQELRLYNERFEGYKAALSDAGMAIDKDFIIDGTDENAKGYHDLKELVSHQNRPDGIFATSDLKAISAIRAIKDMKLKVPEDISVIGFDNLEMSSYIDPTLSTISQPLYEMGIRAVNKLIQIIESETKMKSQIEMLSCDMIIRKSTR